MVEKQTILCFCGMECTLERNSCFEYQGTCTCDRVWTLKYENPPSFMRHRYAGEGAAPGVSGFSGG
jgi:hypothetical protein